ncbi:ATP-binding protein [Alisedimentitalea sp. MJ-SS2]|uniref:ATP-binding protein n=1 Tax=Aliisedimentitalea sp. MJ-SS2 TaxID=3049795 RepID=UPI0029150E7D|nr:ATP-binding protein [Alisedimentitalea sp. MJ-SS2]MDU8929661.1 ATP-binding protein [Alisedimentitalea sp. MJ-SS2]
MKETETPIPDGEGTLISRLHGDDRFDLTSQGEDTWVEVIRQMDRVYGELVESQIALEEKNAELESAQEFISSVVSSMTDLLIVCDTDGHIQQVNDALLRLTGLGPDMLIGQPLTEVLKGRDTEIQERFHRHLRANESFHDCEVLLRKQKEPIPLSLNCSIRHDSKGKPAGLVLIGRPVGELQRAYRELDEALRKFEKAQRHLVSSEKMAALGRLVAGVAHELNNPISFIFGNMHALRTYGEKITRYFAAINSGIGPDELSGLRHELQIDRIEKDILPLVEGTLEGAERVSDIVQDLRRFSGNQVEPSEEFVLEPIIRTAVNWVLRGARDKPEVKITCPASLKVAAKKGHIHQILVNLLQNALDAVSGTSAARIQVTVEDGGDQVTILVRDNGPGIDAGALDQVFEPFFTTKPIGQGTGLGLYVSYRMADELGGRLSAEMNGAEGACFRLVLPGLPAEETP